MPEERCSLKSLGLPVLKDLTFCSLKTFPDSFRMTSARRAGGWTFATILGTLDELGYHVAWQVHNSAYAPQISEFPNSAKECCAAACSRCLHILEKNPEAKYYLSLKQTQKLLSKGLAGVRVIGFTTETD